jgi:hypothetical protein
MLDLRLPYFYNLPIVVLLILSVYSRLEGAFIALGSWNLNRTINWGGVDSETLLYLKLLLITLPAMTAAAYFIKQFYDRNDVYVRETLFILGVVNFLGYLIPAFLR